MNWIKANKFLFAFLLIVAIGAGVLGYFLFGAMSRYEDAHTDYTAKASELNRLQRLQVFPNQKNLNKLAEQKKQMGDEVSKLAEHVAAQQIPLEEITSETFQDRLKATVTALKAKADKSSPSVALPPKFFLGFDDYENRPPDLAAAPALGRELKAMEWLVGLLIDRKVTEIRVIDRAKLPQEAKGKIAGAAPKPDRPEKPEKAAKPGDKVDADVSKVARRQVQRDQITLTFQCNQARLKEFLNAVVSYQGQFFIPRLVTVHNEKEKGPARVLSGIANPGGSPNPSAPNATPSSPATTSPSGVPPQLGTAPAAVAPVVPDAPVATFIVGDERIEATVVLDMVEFTEVAAK